MASIALLSQLHGSSNGRLGLTVSSMSHHEFCPARVFFCFKGSPEPPKLNLKNINNLTM